MSYEYNSFEKWPERFENLNIITLSRGEHYQFKVINIFNFMTYFFLDEFLDIL